MFFSCVYWFLTWGYAEIALFFAKESAIYGTRCKSYPWYYDIALYMKNVKWCKYNLNCLMQSWAREKTSYTVKSRIQPLPWFKPPYSLRKIFLKNISPLENKPLLWLGWLTNLRIKQVNISIVKTWNGYWDINRIPDYSSLVFCLPRVGN